MTRLHVSARFAPYSATPELAVRHAVDVAHTDGMYRESFAPQCWLASDRPASVQFDHDTADVGQVIVVAGVDRWWYADMQVESDDAALLERCVVGNPVSIGARVLTRMTTTHTDTRVCRHRGAWLEHIAILKPGSLPGYRGAKITAVSEATVKVRQAALSDAQAYDELWRRVDQRGEEFMDAYNALGGANRPHNWYLPAHPKLLAA